MTKSSEYGELGPYELKDKQGRIMENIWQFSKVYEIVPRASEVYTQRYSIPVWQHPMEIHIQNGYFTPEFWRWRDKGMRNKMAVRYPVGRQNMHKCKFAIPYDTIAPSDGEKVSISSIDQLDYIQARKRIYLPVYINLVKEKPKFKELQERR